MSEDQTVSVREALRQTELGDHGVLDAAAVVAMFVAISRIVDLTGHKSMKAKVIENREKQIVWFETIHRFCVMQQVRSLPRDAMPFL